MTVIFPASDNCLFCQVLKVVFIFSIASVMLVLLVFAGSWCRCIPRHFTSSLMYFLSLVGMPVGFAIPISSISVFSMFILRPDVFSNFVSRSNNFRMFLVSFLRANDVSSAN